MLVFNTEKQSFYSKHGVYILNTESRSHRVFFKNTKEQRNNVLSAVEDTEAAKAAFTKSTKISIPAMLCFHPAMLYFHPAMLCFHPVGFVATFKSLVIFVSRKNFVPSFLCV